jgi:hypothetical protein
MKMGAEEQTTTLTNEETISDNPSTTSLPDGWNTKVSMENKEDDTSTSDQIIDISKGEGG